MPPTDTPFEQFFAEKIKERGTSLKRLSEATGIAAPHIESLLRGDFENMPAAPYLHGYLVRLGETLDFDGEEWWIRLKKTGVVKNSGSTDALPKNRFIKQAPPNYIWWILIGVIVLIFLAFQAPRIFGTPKVTVNVPSMNPYVTQSSTFIISGTVNGADSLFLVGTEGVAEQITVGAGGAWQQGVLLGTGPNQFEIIAKKFLGGQTSVTEQIFYEPAGGTGASSTATSTASSSLFAPSGAIPAGTSGASSGTPSL